MLARHLAAATLIAVTAMAVSHAPVVAQSPSSGGQRIIVSEDADYFGFDYRTVQDVTLDGCKAACLKDSGCRAFTYNTKARWCFMKSDFGELKAAPGAIAGRVTSTAASTIDDGNKPPALGYLSSDLNDAAVAYRNRITSLDVPAQGVTALQRMAGEAAARGERKDAANLMGSAVRLVPDDHGLWLGLARALLALGDQGGSDATRFFEYGTSSAINAYSLSRGPDERAAALAALGLGLERLQRYRLALNAYTDSLALVPSAALRSAYDKLRAEHGFRVVDYSVEADSSTPRACIQFSEDLQTENVDYSKYVTVDGVTPEAIEARDRQICIDGLRHGQRYRVGLRPGVPSTVGEVIDRPIALSIFVRDRKPSARFTGRNFVLPRVGSRGVPVVTVNAETLKVSVYRVGDRSLADIVRDDELFTQLDSYAAERIAGDSGALVWSGELDVKPTLNEDVTTSFPIDEALPERLPGLYVMVAEPKTAKIESWDSRATQWFVVSDIGLTTLEGSDGLHVFARSLSTAKGMDGVEVSVIARNNEVLGTARTDGEGHARFEAGLTRGKGGAEPALVTAALGAADYTFLQLNGPGFDLSDRGVEGREAPGPLDGFLYTERGVYRPGETVHLAALVRDQGAKAVESIPLTFVFTRPDGVEYRRILSQETGAGGHAVDLDLQGSAMRGTWKARAYADPKSDAIAETLFLVEDFVPDRIEFDLTTEAKQLASDQPATVDVDGRFLYGAPATGLRLEGDLTIRPVTTIATYPGYRFGLADDDAVPDRTALEDLPATDDDGKATFEISAESLPATTRALAAKLAVRMREGGGRAVERSLELPVSTDSDLIGIRPLFDGDELGEGQTAQFDVIAVSGKAERIALAGLKWQLVKLERNFQWYQENGSWRYEAVTYTKRIADGTIDVTAGNPARIAGQIEWGRYRLEVESPDADGPAASVEFNGGWYVATSGSDTPDILQVGLDKKAYRPGEVARLSITPRFAGTALVMVVGERLIDMKAVEVGTQETVVELPVGDDWGAGAYVTASLLRPTDVAGSHMPGRALGLKWLGVDQSDRTLGVAFDLPERTTPRQSVTIPVTITGAAAGNKAYVTVAAVDVGILNLTNYQPPAPEGWYYGQRKLGMEIRDVYGLLIDGMQGERGQIRSGSDDAGATMEGSPPTQEPVSLFSGIVEVGADGKAEVIFDVPEFNGTLRVMAVAWTHDAVGHGTTDLVVRDPVVVTASLPRVLAPGDTSRLRLDIDNTDGPAGDYALTIEATGEISFGDMPQAVTLETGRRQVVAVPITGIDAGVAEIGIRLAHASGTEISQSLRLPVRPAQGPTSERQVVALAPGERLDIGADRLGGLVAGTGSVSVAATRTGALDVPSLLLALDRYPYGCAEQTTSRALPLLYLSSVAAQTGIADDAAIKERVQKAVFNVLAKQAPSGSFGLWGPGSGDLWLDSYVSDFLTRAREEGYEVPELGFNQAIENLRNSLGYAPDVKTSGGQDVAYALYVLARNRQASLGDLRYYADEKLGEFASPLAKAQIGAALALYGERLLSAKAFDAATADLRQATATEDYSRSDYGSNLRDGAATLALAAETKPTPGMIPDLTRLVTQTRASRHYTSTQENAWLLLAAHGLLSAPSQIALEVDGQSHAGDLMRRMTDDELSAHAVSIVNRGQDPVDAVVTVTGVQDKSLPAGGDGFRIERAYYSLGGEELPIETVGQNERFVVVLSITEENSWASRLLVEDLLPAGFEIDNPSLVQSANLQAFPWLSETQTAHLEFRDDRFVAALERKGGDPRAFTLAYMVRAVTPGRYTLPAATVEDMYRPHLNARTAMGEVEVIAPKP